MSRHYCDRGIHLGATTFAWRIVLAKLCLDLQAEQIVVDEIGDCVGCWREVVDILAQQVWSDTVQCNGVPDLNPGTGLAEGQAVDYATVLLYDALNAAARDARDLGAA